MSHAKSYSKTKLENEINPEESQINKSGKIKFSISIEPDFSFSVSNQKKQNGGISNDRFIPIRKCEKMKSYLTDNTFQFKDKQSENLCNIYRRHVLNLQNSKKFQFTSYLKENDQFLMQDYLKQLNSTTNDQSTKLRKIPKAPYKVLDAPALQDDFYLNLIDWSTQNILAVGLGSAVYLWAPQTGKVTKLCDLSLIDSISSLVWLKKNSCLAVGTNLGQLQLWDINKLQKVRTFVGHSSRIGSLAQSSSTLTSGSKDKSILTRDIRSQANYIYKLTGHKQQICGLKWSFDQQQLASGGNDNKLFLWNLHSTNPIYKFHDHNAAVKALAWSPHQHGLLASGGGTADRKIRFWNSLEGKLLNTVDTGSQVCNLMFSKTVNQIVSTHGYSQNQVTIWKYPQMTKITSLSGHSFRVLYLAMSPDGKTIVTGAGDQTLRFWNAFPGKQTNNSLRKVEDTKLICENLNLR